MGWRGEGLPGDCFKAASATEGVLVIVADTDTAEDGAVEDGEEGFSVVGEVWGGGERWEGVERGEAVEGVGCVVERVGRF